MNILKIVSEKEANDLKERAEEAESRVSSLEGRFFFSFFCFNPQKFNTTNLSSLFNLITAVIFQVGTIVNFFIIKATKSFK